MSNYTYLDNLISRLDPAVDRECQQLADLIMGGLKLHLALGLGEDWNTGKAFW